MSGYLGTKAVLLSTTSATVGGDSTVGGDLTVDTNTLYVDSTNNRVGIGNAAPTQALDVTGDIVTSGGVYLGGTGSANYLDDYEEGTWTPTNAGAALTITEAKYTKVGRMVTVACYITADANTSGNWGGLPFSVDATGTYCGSVGYQNDTSGQTWNVIADSGTSWTMRNGTTSEQLLSGKNCRMTLTYFTT